jgi:hypothetical protein
MQYQRAMLLLMLRFGSLSTCCVYARCLHAFILGIVAVAGDDLALEFFRVFDP